MSPDDVIKLVNRIKPWLTSHPPGVQGAALADLLAIWLAEHAVEGDPGATYQLRETLLEEHIDFVRKLVWLNAKTSHLTRGHHHDH
jgi:hypothetical protein